MLQTLENIWNILTAINDFLLNAFSSLYNGVVFCFNMFTICLAYLNSFGPMVGFLITSILVIMVTWLVLRIIHG